MDMVVPVPTGEYKVAKPPGMLGIYGLGSCVGVSIYDPVTKVGGLAHVLLPDSLSFQNKTQPGKFADLALPLLVAEMRKSGTGTHPLIAKIAGGAQMFSESLYVSDIGIKNISSVKRVLQSLGIRLMAEATGGNKGRTMVLNIQTGEVFIRQVGDREFYL